MKVTFTTRHFEPTEALKERINKKLGRLDKFGRIDHLEVVLELDGRIRKAELIAKLRHEVLTAKGEDHNIYNAFLTAYRKLEHQLRNYEERITSHHK